MAVWWLDKVLPGVVGGLVLGVIAYVRLYFEKRWPYWGRRDSNGNV
jgi:hypothetical protein